MYQTTSPSIFERTTSQPTYNDVTLTSTQNDIPTFTASLHETLRESGTLDVRETGIGSLPNSTTPRLEANTNLEGTGKLLTSQERFPRLPVHSPQAFFGTSSLSAVRPSLLSPQQESFKAASTIPDDIAVDVKRLSSVTLEPQCVSQPNRERDPLRLSRFLTFPTQVGPHGAEVHLFDGLMNRNVHDIQLLKSGYYGIRLSNLNESAWDGLYLGMGKMKAVVDFEVCPPPPELLNSPKNATNRQPSVDQSIRKYTSQTSQTIDQPEGSGSPGSTPPLSRESSDCMDKSRKNSLTGRSDSNSMSERIDLIEEGVASDSPPYQSESIKLVEGRGQLICKAQQEKVVYFFVPHQQSQLKLQASTSLTFGMRVRCSYDILFCGSPKIVPPNPLIPFLKNASILCLDGGGVLGISSLKILERLELEIQKELRDPSVRLLDCFDMICGTSTGGIITLGLLTGLSIKEMIHMWASMSGRIFEGNRTLFSGIFFEGYDVTRLKNALTQNLGQRFMSSYSHPYCFVTSTDVKHNPYQLFLFRNYTHHHLGNHEHRGGSVVPIWTAAWATAAAPTYLKGPNPEDLEKMGLLIDPEVQLCDGAMKANNPTMVALEEAARLSGKKLQSFIESELDVLLSIGTGQPTLRQTIERMNTVSTFQILLNSAHLLTSSTNVHRDVLHWFGDREDRYFRFNVPGIGDIPLDAIDRSSYDLILKATNDYLSDEKYYDIKRLVKKLSYRIRR